MIKDKLTNWIVAVCAIFALFVSIKMCQISSKADDKTSIPNISIQNNPVISLEQKQEQKQNNDSNYIGEEEKPNQSKTKVKVGTTEAEKKNQTLLYRLESLSSKGSKLIREYSNNKKEIRIWIDECRGALKSRIPDIDTKFSMIEKSHVTLDYHSQSNDIIKLLETEISELKNNKQ